MGESSESAWQEKEMRDVGSERTRLTDSSAPGDTWKLRVVNLSGLALASALLILVAAYSFHDGPTLFSFHPVAMTLGWMVLMPMAINALRAGDVASSWLPPQQRSTRHWLLQAVAATSVTVGFLVILTNKIRHAKDHFATIHSVFGLVSVIFMFVTLSGGLGALYSLKLKDYLPPVYTKLIHGFAGLITLSLGVITIILGLFGNIVTEEWAKYLGAVLAILVAVLTILRPAIGIYVRLKERLNYVR